MGEGKGNSSGTTAKEAGQEWDLFTGVTCFSSDIGSEGVSREGVELGGGVEG